MTSPFDTLNTKIASGSEPETPSRSVSAGRDSSPVSRPMRADPRGRHDPNRPVSEMAEYGETPANPLHIRKDDYPEGFELIWATKEVHGQPVPEIINERLRRGYNFVHEEDFEGRYRHRWTPSGHQGAIEYNGLALMARSKAWGEKGRAQERAAAKAKVRSVEEKHRGGVLSGTTLLSEGAQHDSARRWSGIKKTIEPLDMGPITRGDEE